MACYWDRLSCYYTYDYVVDISQQEVGKKKCYSRGGHDTKRERPRPPSAESGGASKVRHVQETARREVDLSSIHFEDDSKPGLKRTLRLLSCNLSILSIHVCDIEWIISYHIVPHHTIATYGQV